MIKTSSSGTVTEIENKIPNTNDLVRKIILIQKLQKLKIGYMLLLT